MSELSVVAKKDDDSMDLPPGFRFHPTDEEIITKYLSEKVTTPGFTARAIGEVDLNKCEPWELPSKAKMGEKEWYFFCQKDRKYPTGMRTNRATGLGYWKATGKDKEIFRGKDILVGMKKTLVFYKGRAPKGEKTNWVMHEFRLEGHPQYPNLPRITKDEWVVCKVFHKSIGIKGHHIIGVQRMDSPASELNSQLVPSYLSSEDRPSSSFPTDEEARGAVDHRFSLAPSNVVDTEHLRKSLLPNFCLNTYQGSSSFFSPQTSSHNPYFLLQEPANLSYLHQEQAMMKALPDHLTIDHRGEERYSNYMLSVLRDAELRHDQKREISSDNRQQVMRTYHELDGNSSAGPALGLDGLWKY